MLSLLGSPASSEGDEFIFWSVLFNLKGDPLISYSWFKENALKSLLFFNYEAINYEFLLISPKET